MNLRLRRCGAQVSVLVAVLAGTPLTARLLAQSVEAPPSYLEEDVSYANGAGISLAGTLTLPAGTGPFPAVVLVAGAGPQTREYVVAGHALYRDLAVSLALRGLAVLRADKRGVGRSAGSYEQATLADFADDAEAAVAYLAMRKEIDPRHIGLLGHDEGGVVAPMVASRSNPNFLVIIAGDTFNGEDTLLLKSRLTAKAAGLSEVAIDQNAELQERAFAIVRQKDRAAAEGQLADLYDRDPAAQLLSPAEREAAVQFLTSPWMRFFLDYDPAPALANVRCPIRALYGQKDLEVPADPNYDQLGKILAGRNHDFALTTHPGMNHLFQRAKIGLPDEYAALTEPLPPSVVDDIATWILFHTAPKPAPSPRAGSHHPRG